MDSKKRILILLAVVIVALAFFVIRGRMEPAPPPQEAAPATATNNVLVANRDMAPGTFIQPVQDLGWAPIAEESVKPGALRESTAKIDDFTGAVVRRQIRAGDQIQPDFLTKSGDGGFMSAVLEPGMRAISIAVNSSATGNAGFISPGDRVDLILTHRVKGKRQNGDDAIIGETFVRNVRVLAVDQQLDNPENKAILAKTVTLEVTPLQAQQIQVGVDMGKVSVALRSLAAAQAGQAEKQEATVTQDRDLSPVLGADNLTARLRIIRGDQTEVLELY